MVSARRVPTNELIETYNKAGGADYDSFAVWESLRDVNLPAITTSYGLKVVGLGPHADSLLLFGSTTNASYWRRVFLDPSVMHDGTPNVGAYFNTDPGGLALFRITENYSQIQDIVASTTRNSVASRAVFSLEASIGGAFVGCISDHPVNTGGLQHGFECALTVSGTGRLVDCISIGAQNVGFNYVNGAPRVLNCTAIGSGGIGFKNGYTYINCIAQQNISSGFEGVSKTTCISDDTTGNIQATLTFVDAPNDNYRLDASDTAAIGAGTDLSADATYPFDDDIVGETRTAPWDVGAFKFIDPVLPVEISETALASDAFTVAASMAHQLQEMALAGDSWAQNMIANLMLTDGAVASDSYTPSLSASLSISEIVLASDTWIGRLYASATISEIALASDMFDTFNPVERGMIHAIIRIMPAISARIDINKHYNE